tara:strand:- start:2845 stop:3660 length:816 start_codon:yes stop_codon:yes gene_type:complete
MQRVEVNEPTADELVNPTLEEELEMQEKARENKNTTEEEKAPEETPEETPEEATTTEEEEVIEERPEWLPEKFKSPEDLAKAYSELEKTQGNKNTEQQEQQEQPLSNVSDVIQNASDSYYENGELSTDNYKALEESGIPREFVDAYVKGQEATMEAEVSSITSSVGGQENYDDMVQWAQANLPDSEIDSYDELVSTGTTEVAKMAVKGLYARYMSEDGGSSVNIAKGATSGSTIQPFGSMAQVTTAMKDKRYQQDPSFRREVEQRISISNL